MVLDDILPEAETIFGFGPNDSCSQNISPRFPRSISLDGAKKASLYTRNSRTQKPETADHLLRSLDASRMDKWTSAVER
ncbi:hypothetical protein JTB14_030100 [Gonioctena quinquepunctata]|nr:hypothetical protein JTB14_030100 [Gonioctena quinquepunctata]